MTQLLQIWCKGRFVRLGAALVFSFLLVGHFPVASSSLQLPILIHTGQELRVSHDGGEHWQRVDTPFNGARINQLLTETPDSSQIYAATDWGIYQSEDGGMTWKRLATGGNPAPEAVYSVASVSDRLFIGTDRGLFLSQDGGASWLALTAGFPERALPLCIQVGMRSGRVMYVGTARDGVFRSQDGGRHWLASSHGLPPAVGSAPVTPVKHLIVDPTDEDVVYATTEVNGLYKTTSGGRRWQSINVGLPGLFPYRTYQPLIAMDASSPKTMYAVLGYPVHSQRIDNKVYRSTDGGAHWSTIWNLPSNLTFVSLRINPNQPDELLIGYKGGILRAGTKGSLLPVRRPRPVTPAAAAADMDIGDVAVLQDSDGTLAHLFNLEGQTLDLTFSRGRYRSSLQGLKFETDLGEKLTLRNNDMVPVELPFTLPFFRDSHTRINVGSNGNLTLGPLRDRIATPNLDIFAARPRIAVLWDNYDPTAAPDDGGVFVRVDSSRVVITWNKVPEDGETDSNTFQVVLFRSGNIRMSYKELDNPSGGLAGLSPGDDSDVFPAQFTEDVGRTFPGRPFGELFDGELDLRAIGQRFYAVHPDRFDFIVAWGGSSILNGVGGTGFAFYLPIQNDVAGIGQPTGSFNGGARAFGSNRRLQGALNLNSLRFYPTDPNRTVPGLGTNSTMDIMGQEAGHRWGAFVRFRDGNRNSNELLGRAFAHWSFFFDSDASELEGNDWQDNEDGTFTTVAATERYSPLDQYLMGLRGPAEVPDSFLIRNSPIDTNCFGEGPQACPPQLNVTTSGTRVDVSINQIIRAEGTRSPAVGRSPTTFSQAFILVIPAGDERLMEDAEKLDRIRQAWEVFFHQATDERGTIITGLGE